MSEIQRDSSGVPYCCQLCFSIGNLSRCGRCHSAYYCSKEHQVEHWKVHKVSCKNMLPLPVSNDINIPNKNSNTVITSLPSDLPEACQTLQAKAEGFPAYSVWCQNNAISDSLKVIEKANDEENLYHSSNVLGEAEKTCDFQMSHQDYLFSSLSSELLSSANNYWDVIDTCESQNSGFQYGLRLSSDKMNEEMFESSVEDISFLQENISENIGVHNTENSDTDDVTEHEMCLNIVHDLNIYGICVIDNFLGYKLGDEILKEVKNLFHKGVFQKGQIVNSKVWMSNENIRGDVITWVEGLEPCCIYIGSLIKKLDLVMTKCSKMHNNGILNNYKLSRRTKAMVACYPGNGTHYMKHVDNPNEDGRCITCIYYLNKDWNTKTQGGLLRMFPSGYEKEVANIEPIFDRMLFFWSDRRNPHEVLPSYAVRFAITVWYFDSDERERALLRTRMKKL